MAPALFHAKEEQHDGSTPYDPTPLKIHRPPPPPPPPSSSSTATTSDPLTNKHQLPPPRRPVIIYTHSPKVIHTHPRDFMSLVQKLTGYTPPPEKTQPVQDRRVQGNTEDNESTSVVTEEHGSSVNDIPQVNSCFLDAGVGVGVGVAVAPPQYRAAAGYDPYFNPSPVFSANPDYLCTPSHQLPYYNPDSMFLNRNSLSSSSTSLRVLKEYQDI